MIVFRSPSGTNSERRFCTRRQHGLCSTHNGIQLLMRPPTSITYSIDSALLNYSKVIYSRFQCSRTLFTTGVDMKVKRKWLRVLWMDAQNYLGVLPADNELTPAPTPVPQPIDDDCTMMQTPKRARRIVDDSDEENDEVHFKSQTNANHTTSGTTFTEGREWRNFTCFGSQ